MAHDMRKLSDRTCELLKSLPGGLSFWQQLTGGKRVTCEVLADIGRSGEPGAIPYLVRFLLAPSADVASAASIAVHQLILATPVEDLVWLDEQVRSWSYWQATEPWTHLQPQQVHATAALDESRTSVLGLLTFHPNGRVRQAAVVQLGQLNVSAGLPFLLIRLNDWVANVRASALEIVQQWLAQGPFEPFVSNLYLISRLAECQRADFSGIIHSIAGKLLQPEHIESLLRLITVGDRRIGRQWFVTALSFQGAQVPRLVKAGLASEDVIIRSRAARVVPTIFQNEELANILVRLRKDVFATVRSEAIAAQIERFPESATVVLEEGLLDRSPSVREFARYCLRTDKDYDVASFYRQAMQNKPQLAVALLGLGESGAQVDVSFILPYLESHATSERRAAVQALSRLAGDDCLAVFLGCLRDDSPKIVKAAEKWLAQRVHLVDLESMFTLLSTDKRTHVRHAALSILDHADTWKTLPYSILAARDDDQTIRLKAQTTIESRINRIFTRPSEQEAALIRRALLENALGMEEKFVMRLRQWLTGLVLSHILILG